MRYETISDYVDSHRDEAIKFLQTYLRIPSPTGSEKAVADYLSEHLKDNGFDPYYVEAEKDRPNLLCDWKGAEGKSLLFNGHLDVFPSEENATRDPWSGEIDGDKIYARGATDMKAGNAAGILAMCYLKQMGYTPKGTVSIALNCDEEQGGKAGILHCISKGLMKADFTICMEASEDTIIVETDGRIAWKVTFNSDGWHAGTRLPKKDALAKAHEAVSAIMEYDKKLFNERYFHDSNTGAVINVTGTSAGYEGKTVNMHPTMCTIWIDRRYTKGETVESAEKELREVLDAVDGLKGSYEIEKLYSCVRSTISADDPDIIKGMKAYETVFKSPIHPGRRNGGGDAVKLAVAYNQRVPQLGPGIYDVLGTNDEYVPLSQFLNYIKVYMLFTVNYFE